MQLRKQKKAWKMASYIYNNTMFIDNQDGPSYMMSVPLRTYGTKIKYRRLDLQPRL